MAPDNHDVVVRNSSDELGTAFVIGTVSAPQQFLVRSRKDAIEQAIGFAQRHHVRAWLTNGDGQLVLLGAFRKEEANSVRRA